MRNSLFLLFCGLLAVSPSMVQGAVVRAASNNVAPAKTVGEDELEFAVMLTGQAYRQQLEIMRSMKDAVSTANAVPALRKSMCTRYKLQGMGFDYAEYCERCDELIRQETLDCAREQQRLAEASFYGVEPAQALFEASDPTMQTGVGELLLAAAPLPAEELDELAERLRWGMTRYQQEHKWLVGGPGFSRESAWVVTVEDDVMSRERDFLRSVLHVSPCGQSLHEVDDRVYHCLYSVYTHNGEPYRLEQWFDVTLYHKVGMAESSDDQVAEDTEVPQPAPEEEELVAEEVEEEEEELIAEDPDED